MSLTIGRSFSFIQQAVQNVGGWCMGISLSIIKGIMDYSAAPNNPAHACDIAENICRSLMQSTYDDRLAPFKGAVRNLQRTYERGGKPSGSYDYDLNQACLVLLGTYVNPNNLPDDSAYGSHFQGWLELDAANHSGVAAWDGTNQLFVFDPNTGGAIATFSGMNLKEAIDATLAHLYALYDRLSVGQGPSRRAVLKWARSLTGDDITGVI
jgi:hypothetical protein